MSIYRLRMIAKLLVPLDVGTPGSDTLTLNDHSHADELEFECAWGDYVYQCRPRPEEA